MESWGVVQGVYAADRAAALAGVPRSTLYDWARKDIWTPSRRPERPKLWAFTDVVAARIIYWLRHDKPELESARTSMHEVRQVLDAIREKGSEIWDADVRIFVDRSGHVFFESHRTLRRATKPWSSVEPGALDVLAEFSSGDGRIGPTSSDLVDTFGSFRGS